MRDTAGLAAETWLGTRAPGWLMWLLAGLAAAAAIYLILALVNLIFSPPGSGSGYGLAR